jgi:hypothetical protein
MASLRGRAAATRAGSGRRPSTLAAAALGFSKESVAEAASPAAKAWNRAGGMGGRVGSAAVAQPAAVAAASCPTQLCGQLVQALYSRLLRSPLLSVAALLRLRHKPYKSPWT